MLSSVEQAFVGREEIRAPLKTPAWEAMRNHVKNEAPEEEAGCALIVPAFDGLNLQKFCGPSRETNGSKWWPLDAID